LILAALVASRSIVSARGRVADGGAERMGDATAGDNPWDSERAGIWTRSKSDEKKSVNNRKNKKNKKTMMMTKKMMIKMKTMMMKKEKMKKGGKRRPICDAKGR
jgi:hypothetical protein